MLPLYSELKLEKPPFVTVRKFRRAARRANYVIGSFWFRHIFKKHFRKNAKNIYGHAKRTDRWIKYKKRVYAASKAGEFKGEVRPEAPATDNLWTGLLKRSVEIAIIRGFPTRCSAYFSTPSYAPAFQKSLEVSIITAAAKGRKSNWKNQPHKVREIFTHLPEEMQVLAHHADHEFHKQIEEARQSGETKGAARAITAKTKARR